MLTQLPTTPEIANVNDLLSYLLGILLFVIGFLYREKSKEVSALKVEHKDELKELKEKVNQLYDDNISDLKFFDKDKTQTIIDFTTILDKQSTLLSQIKELMKDDKR